MTAPTTTQTQPQSAVAGGRSPVRRRRIVDSLTRTTRRYWLHVRLLLRSAPGLTVLCTLLTIASAGATTAAMYTTGHLIGILPALTRGGSGGTAATWLAWTAVAWVAGPVLAAAADTTGAAVSRRYLVTTFDMLAEAGTAPYGVDCFDDAAFVAGLEGLHQSMRDWTFVMGVDSTWVVLNTRLAGVGAFVLACTWNWWAALILVAGYLGMGKTVTTWINTFYDEALGGLTRGGRRAAYFRGLLTGTDSGKEIRLFGLAGYFLDGFRATWLATMRPLWRRRARTLWPVAGSLLVAFVLNGGVFWLLARDALAGRIGVASIAVAVQALLGLEGFGPIGDPLSALARNTAGAARLADVRRQVGLPAVPPGPGATTLAGRTVGGADDPTAVDGPGPRASTASEGGWPEGAAPTAGRPAAARPRIPNPTRARGAGAAAAEIRLDGVTFTYPSRDVPTLRDLTLHVPAGQSLAAVGVNGAGKSTLIKLLCGLYAPDAGTVRIGGRDPSADPHARRRVAVIFQDFVRYQLSLRDNVAFGAGGDGRDADGLARSLHDAGADGLLGRLGSGWETILSPGYAGGTDLSGGQWQRVALARALAAVQASAGVLVLDEPTAALDVRAEAALFDRFLEVTQGLTTVLVSHRLSSVRHADRIVVIAAPSNGARSGVVEDGSHEELLALGGEYAHMFTLQARRFAKAGGADD
ncbi:MAG TPA: ABC transporter ATP-binding protein [Nocardioidaceae bacterium]|nr:ABC transporter ATP-binding protein [Nocardioidaceae bacterium]